MKQAAQQLLDSCPRFVLAAAPAFALAAYGMTKALELLRSVQ